jgi:hypothetical protein
VGGEGLEAAFLRVLADVDFVDVRIARPGDVIKGGSLRRLLNFLHR